MKKTNKFSGADDVYSTKKSIVKVKVSTKAGKLSEKKTYYPKNSKNINEAKSAVGSISKRY